MGQCGVLRLFHGVLRWACSVSGARSDVTYAFLGFHVALRLGRAWWLGDPLSIPLHQLQNGALVLFAFS